jgi:hypothetical protein
MTLKNKIADYFGYAPKDKLEAFANDLTARFDDKTAERIRELDEIKAYSDKLWQTFHKPEPKLKTDVKQIIDAILSQGFKRIGVIQDEFVYIIMFAGITEMYYLQVNYDGEYCYLMKQINCQDIEQLCKMVNNPDYRYQTAAANLNKVHIELEKEIERITVAGKEANKIEYKTLTENETLIAENLKRFVKGLRGVIANLREIK